MSTDTRQLSEREIEILRLVATGLSNQQIAVRLGISVNTVKVHLRNIFGKIGAASRTEATMYAVRSGLIDVVPARVLEVEAPQYGLDIAPADTIDDLDAALQVDAAVAVMDTPEASAPAIQLEPAVEEAASTVVVADQESSLLAPSPQRQVLHVPVSRIALALIVGALILIVVVLLVRPRGRSGAVQVEAPAATPEAAQRWQLQTGLSSPRAGFATASLETFIYVIGGEGATGVVDIVERYDPRSANWTSLSKKPTPVTDVQAVFIGGRIYVPGGRASASMADVTAAFEAYDPRSDTWQELPPLPAPRSGYGLAAVEGILYLFGGWDGSTYRPEVFAYDPSTQEWSTRTAMPTERAYVGVGVVEGTIYVLGGENQRGALTSNEQYIPSAENSRPWVTKAPLPAPRSHFSAAVALNLIHVLGGTSPTTAIQYNVRTDSWQSFPPPPTPVGSQAAVVQQDNLIISLGGRIDSETYSSSVQAYEAVYTLVPFVLPNR